jgi:hypothetical protein
MEPTTPTIRELARRLIALESQRDASAAMRGSDAANVCEKLSVPLSQLAGRAGYHSLITRALAIAKPSFPTLTPVEVRLDGTLQSFDEIGGGEPEAGLAVLVHLLDLLVMFIGEPVTLSIIRRAWPDAAFETMKLSAEGQV